MNNKFKLLRLQSGISTLEMLIAFTVIIVSISGAVKVTFSSQSIGVDSRTSQEALYKAQEILENAIDTSRNDFNAVVNSNGVWNNALQYATSTKISNESECGKQIDVNVTWDQEHNRKATTTLTGLLTNVPLMLALAGDCSVSSVNKFGFGWECPKYLGPGVASLPGQAVDLDVTDKFVFFVNNEPRFYIIDTNDENHPNPLGNLATLGFGFSSLDVAGEYVYIADFKEVATSPSEYKYRFLIINPDQANNYANPVILASENLSGIGLISKHDAENQDWQPKIYYNDGKAYVGTHSVSGPEFHIFDVSDPSDPHYPEEIDNLDLNTDIKDIVVRDGYAFLATSNDAKELIVVDVNPSSTHYLDVVAFYEADNTEDALSLYLLANKIYLGRKGDSNRNMYILNYENIAGTVSVTYATSTDIKDLTSGQRLDINDIKVVGSNIFLATDDSNEEFQVWSTNLSKISSYDCFPGGHTANGIPAIDYENGYIYAAFRSNANMLIFQPSNGCH